MWRNSWSKEIKKEEGNDGENKRRKKGRDKKRKINEKESRKEGIKNERRKDGKSCVWVCKHTRVPVLLSLCGHKLTSCILVTMTTKDLTPTPKPEPEPSLNPQTCLWVKWGPLKKNCFTGPHKDRCTRTDTHADQKARNHFSFFGIRATRLLPEAVEDTHTHAHTHSIQCRSQVYQRKEHMSWFNLIIYCVCVCVCDHLLDPG